MARLGYRDLKKTLNRFHRFSFKMPRSGKDFTPHQKRAITIQWNKLQSCIKAVQKNKSTFINYPKNSKLPHIDGIRTNKGVFYKYPGAKVKKVKQKYIVRLDYKKLREVFLPFPDFIVWDMEKIRVWVELITDQLQPDYVLWSVNGFRGKRDYEPELFSLYMSDLSVDREIIDALEKVKKPFFNGIFIGMFPGSKKYLRDIDIYEAVKNANNIVKEFLS